MLKYNYENSNNAKSLRKNMTLWERKLWFSFLAELPVKIYKQKLIGNYIVDFYCHKCKLVIELDGGQHYDNDEMLKDLQRTKYLNSLGITVVRYSNFEVDRHFDAVCDDIYHRIFG